MEYTYGEHYSCFQITYITKKKLTVVYIYKCLLLTKSNTGNLLLSTALHSYVLYIILDTEILSLSHRLD
ncbi:hypothetical protein C0J52_11742 [Blattella germanica]|nr:hypothetical protein C0J52_11742 [Blattella germanica]